MLIHLACLFDSKNNIMLFVNGTIFQRTSTSLVSQLHNPLTACFFHFVRFSFLVSSVLLFVFFLFLAFCSARLNSSFRYTLNCLLWHHIISYPIILWLVMAVAPLAIRAMFVLRSYRLRARLFLQRLPCILFLQVACFSELSTQLVHGWPRANPLKTPHI